MTMLVKDLIEKLLEMPLDLPVGSTNYYGVFGPASEVAVEKARSESWHKPTFEGRDVVVIGFDLDLQ